MTKKHFIMLADYIRQHNAANKKPFTPTQLSFLADFCSHVNPRFMRERWLGYIAGENEKCGGSVKLPTGK